MLGGRHALAVLLALLLAPAGCGARDATMDDPGASDDAGGTNPPPAPELCGTSDVVTGQSIWALQLAVSGGQVFYTTYGEGDDGHHHGVWSVPAAGGEPSPVWLGPSGILGSGLAVLDGRVYLSTQLTWGMGDEGVLVVPESGDGDSSVVARFESVCAAYGGMAADGAYVYAASSGCPAGTGQILRLPRAGGPATSMWSGNGPGDGASSMALHGTDLYFLRDDDNDGDGAVMRLSTTDGTPATQIGSIDEAHGLAVDDAGVYVTAHEKLWLLPHDGAPAVTLAANLNHPTLVAVDPTGIYVATGNLEDGPVAQVLRVPHGGGAPVVLASHQPTIFSLALDDVAVYWASQTGHLVARAGKCM